MKKSIVMFELKTIFHFLESILLKHFLDFLHDKRLTTVNIATSIKVWSCIACVRNPLGITIVYRVSTRNFITTFYVPNNVKQWNLQIYSLRFAPKCESDGVQSAGLLGFYKTLQYGIQHLMATETLLGFSHFLFR